MHYKVISSFLSFALKVPSMAAHLHNDTPRVNQPEILSTILRIMMYEMHPLLLCPGT